MVETSFIATMATELSRTSPIKLGCAGMAGAWVAGLGITTTTVAKPATHAPAMPAHPSFIGDDGRLDLYVASYVDVDINQLAEPGSAPTCTYRGIATFCGPRGLPGGRDILFHNNGDGTFTDVTEKAGIDRDSYYGLGVVWGDYDKDGREDIYVANDSTPSALYHNNGDGTFTDVGVEAGVGTDFGDYDNDG